MERPSKALGHKAAERRLGLESVAPATPVGPRPSRVEERVDPRAVAKALRWVISVSGSSSNAGKTHLTEDLVRFCKASGRRVTALKVTRTHVGHCPRENDGCGTCESLETPFELIEDRTRLDVKGKDTGRYLRAGADQVLWLLVNPDHVEAGIRAALGRVGGGGVLVAEGNSFRDYCGADLAFMVLSERFRMKPSAVTVLDRIDHFVVKPSERRYFEEMLGNLGVRNPSFLDADDVSSWAGSLVPRP
jgi:hypothetical protein